MRGGERKKNNGLSLFPNLITIVEIIVSLAFYLTSQIGVKMGLRLSQKYEWHKILLKL